MYLRLEGPEQLRLSDGSRVASPADYALWQAEVIADRGIARIWTPAAPVTAYVNHGRWIADCGMCRTPMFVRPEWPLACCPQCGARYAAVAFPPDIAALTTLLCRRPDPENQNWQPPETVDDLRRENEEHGYV